ncbi:IS5 family transposase [Rhodoblastus acidophilus]|uniref:IS5 family transposase n=1 Tax=Rhodoblastus acidophilus TaxID=1074 RepID=UPI003CD02B0B
MSVRLVLGDSQWVRMAPHLPGKVGDPGRSGADNRLFVEAVLWLARTGSPWRDLPEIFGNWNSVFVRFSRWSKDGVWDRLFVAMADDPDFEYIMIDSTIVRSHQHAAGKKGGPEARAIGRSRGGLTTKIHAVVDALGNPLRFILSPGQASDYTQAEALITDLPAESVLGDKGYDSKAFRDAIALQDAVAVIPPRKTSPQVACDFALYCERNLVERFFLKIKHFRRIATRYEQTPRAFMSMLALVSAFIWIK